MATGPLRFRTPHIDELPTAHTRQAPGFAWVAVKGGAGAGASAEGWGTSNRKRQRTTGLGQSESQREALTARQQREIERRIRDLNSDGTKDVPIPNLKKDGVTGSGGGATKAGKTPNTKKILASGKTFVHYLDDEEAELARNGGRREGELEVATQPAAAAQRASKTPIARRKSTLKEEGSLNSSPAPTTTSTPAPPPSHEVIEIDDDTDDDSSLPPLPSQAEMDALFNAPPLTYNQARAGPPPAGAPPARRFCQICGYWGRVKCMKCGEMVCSVLCKDAHDEHKCFKFYA